MSASILVLASASPRRAAILRQIGVEFRQITSRVTDERTATADPRDHVIELSRRKAGEVRSRTSERWILGADTIVVSDGRFLGKPDDEESAARMLRTLQGRVHSVFTGITLIDSEHDRTASHCEETRVWFRRLTDEEIQDYIATGEPLDKAGAYAIQGMGATLVERIEGCYYTVVGLPVAFLIHLMRHLGYPHQFSDTGRTDPAVLLHR